MEVIKFDPAVADLQAIIAETVKITANDLSDKKQLELVKKTRLQLRNARVTIEKQGKAMREDALKYQKDVIARQNELIGIIEPEETRLKDIEMEAEQIKERAVRFAALPSRRKQLSDIGDGVEVENDLLLEMDTERFSEYVAERLAVKAEKERLEKEAEALRKVREKEIEEAKERARLEERERMEKKAKEEEETKARIAQKLVDDAKAEAARIERDAREKVERDERAKVEAVEKERVERERMEKKVKYQSWLKSIGYKEEEKELWRFEVVGAKTKAFLYKSEY